MLFSVAKKIYNRLDEKVNIPLRYYVKLLSAKKFSDNKVKKINHQVKVAIHFHVFYVDLLDEIYSHVQNIKTNLTLFFTVTNDSDFKYVKNYVETKMPSQNVKIIKVENKGRDILPFYLALHDCYSDYDIIAHFHTKKSLHTSFGEIWRKYLYNNLLGTGCFFDNLCSYISNEKTVGFVTTPIVPVKSVINAYFSFSDNKTKCKDNIDFALSKFSVSSEKVFSSRKNMDFPCGNMFVAKTVAVKQFFAANLNENDFPEENGQLTGTLQHYVELMWKYIVVNNGYKYIEVLNRNSNI